MKILVTGARGFVGRNLCLGLRNVMEGKDRTRPGLKIGAVFEYDLGSSREQLESYCSECDFVFNLAGVNRPEDRREFMEGNRGFAEELLGVLRRHGNACPVMLASSVQASLTGRYAGSEYGRSKLAAEELFFDYAQSAGAKALVYRFTNLFGKWCRPDYNSAVATFCHNIANGLPVRVDCPDAVLELTYIDDLVAEMMNALEGRENRCADGKFCAVEPVHRVALGEVVRLLRTFEAQPRTLAAPAMPPGSFENKLFSTFLSYLPADRIDFFPQTHADARGSFTELIRTDGCGQVSVNVIRPGVVKGMHWHSRKWEQFTAVSGQGVIRQRKIGTAETVVHEVSGKNIRTVYILPGYTHSVENTSETEDLVMVMWVSEPFDPSDPDTFAEPV